MEVAFRSIETPINGTNVHITRQFRAKMNASQSPLDAEWSYEVAEAVMRAGLDRNGAGELIKKIFDDLRDKPVVAPYNDIREFYDLVHHKPLPDFEKAYLKVKEKVSGFGLNFG